MPEEWFPAPSGPQGYAPNTFSTDGTASAGHPGAPWRMIAGSESAGVSPAWRMICTPRSTCWSAHTIGGRMIGGPPVASKLATARLAAALNE